MTLVLTNLLAAPCFADLTYREVLTIDPPIPTPNGSPIPSSFEIETYISGFKRLRVQTNGKNSSKSYFNFQENVGWQLSPFEKSFFEFQWPPSNPNAMTPFLNPSAAIQCDREQDLQLQKVTLNHKTCLKLTFKASCRGADKQSQHEVGITSHFCSRAPREIITLQEKQWSLVSEILKKPGRPVSQKAFLSPQDQDLLKKYFPDESQITIKSGTHPFSIKVRLVGGFQKTSLPTTVFEIPPGFKRIQAPKDGKPESPAFFKILPPW